MIDLVELIYKYGICKGDKYHIGIGNFVDDIIDANFYLLECDTGIVEIAMEFIYPIQEKHNMNGVISKEPLHNTKYIIQNIDVKLNMYHVPFKAIIPDVHFKNCLVQPGLMYQATKTLTHATYTNCIEKIKPK